RRGKFMVYARKPLIYAGLLNTMVTQSYLNNLIETCPQITRNRLIGDEPVRGFESHRLRHM
ncbi:MAG: hypothetical protein PHY90_01155, partial [Desulfitobacteriaceae bacterium]|nr:hypothetical protein [Desulfitobacteriaceae bacterium]